MKLEERKWLLILQLFNHARMRSICLLACILLLIAPVFAQNKTAGVRGKVTDGKGTPLPFAGISVKGSPLGTLANSDGVYELPLPEGEHTLHFQFLGFKTEAREIVAGNTIEVLDVALQEQALSLRELQVGKDSEDPAYTIMRKAIAKAKYHQLQIESYSASVYARSTAVPTKIPVLMRKRLKKQGVSEGVAFVNESVTKVDFKRPNSYTQRIVSTQNNVDNSTPTPNEFIFASFYNPEVAGTVTPLSPRALGIYKFEYEGYFEDRGEIINKIKVTPKSFKQGVFKGSIYIIDGRWAIHSFNLQTLWQGFNIQVRQLFAPSQDVWIPTSQHFDINGSYLGFAGKFTYIVSIQYDKLKIDPTLQESVSIVDTKREPEALPKLPGKQNLEKLLASGDQVDTKTFRKTVKEFEKQQRKNETPGYGAREVRRDSIIVEPLAHKRDSTYWVGMRSVPLTQTEVVSYAVSDSVAAIRKANERQPDSTRFKPAHVLSGARYRYGNGRSLTLSAPFRSLAFNPAEAFNFDVAAEWAKRYPDERIVRIAPKVHYSTGRNRLSPSAAIQFENNQKRLTLDGGEDISQFNSRQPIHPLVNTLYYLLLNENHIRVYQRQFARIEYRHRRVWDMMDVTAELETGRRIWMNNLEKRGDLLRGNPALEQNRNVIDYADYPSYFFGSPNYYTTFSLRLDIRPWQQYRIRNGKKRYFSGNEPIFGVHYRKGLAVLGSDVDYDLLEAGVRYEPKVFAASTLQMNLSGGRFFNNRAMTFPDFKHFMGNRTIFQLGDQLSNFRMLPYYYYSTGRNFLQGHASFNSPKLLLTQIPLLRLIGLKEYIQGHMLRTPNTGFYSEQVYGIDGILKILRAEVVTHFDQDLYLGTGFRIGTVFTF